MGIEWGGRNERPRHLHNRSKVARFLNRKSGGLRGVLDSAIDSGDTQASTPSVATKAVTKGPIEMPAAEKMPISEQVLDALDAFSIPGAHHAEMRSAQNVIHKTNPVERLQRK